jgi:hypothetical protein
MIELFNEDKPLSPFVEAVNDARFVKTFGIVALVASLLTCGPGIMAGVGAAIFGFGKTRYYRWLGVSVAVIGIMGFFFTPLYALSAIILGVGIIFKSTKILRVLGLGNQGDPDWHPTRSRAQIGLITGILTCLIGILWFIYFLAVWFMQKKPAVDLQSTAIS